MTTRILNLLINSPKILNNLTQHYLIEAKEVIEKAIILQPNDSVNRNIESIIKDVLSGKRERPTFEDVIK